MIVPIRVDAIASIARCVASRAIMFGEPLRSNTPQAQQALSMLLADHDRRMRSETLLTEVRAIAAPITACPMLRAQGYTPIEFMNYVIDLKQDEDTLWRNIGKQMRGNIRRSTRAGVTIETSNSRGHIERAYAQIRESYRRSMIPFTGIDLFHAAREQLGDVVQVRVATHEGRDIAGTISLAWGDRFFAWYGGTCRPKRLHPFACIVWDEIRWARKQGFSFYDFGGAGEPDQPYGPREFKSRFHGAKVMYGRSQKVYSPRLLAIADSGYRSVRALIRSN